MRPCQLEVGLFGIVGHTFVAEYGNEVTEKKVPGEFVTFDVCRLSVESPRTFGVDLSGEGQVDVVVDGKVVTSVAQIETSAVSSPNVGMMIPELYFSENGKYPNGIASGSGTSPNTI